MKASKQKPSPEPTEPMLEPIPVDNIRVRTLMISHLSDMEHYGAQTGKLRAFTNFVKSLLLKYPNTDVFVDANYEWESFLNKHPNFREYETGKPTFLERFKSYSSKFKWIVDEYAGEGTWNRWEQLAAAGDDMALAGEMNKLWFELPDGRFNIMNKEALNNGWREFLAVIEE